LQRPLNPHECQQLLLSTTSFGHWAAFVAATLRIAASTAARRDDDAAASSRNRSRRWRRCSRSRAPRALQIILSSCSLFCLPVFLCRRLAFGDQSIDGKMRASVRSWSTCVSSGVGFGGACLIGCFFRFRVQASPYKHSIASARLRSALWRAVRRAALALACVRVRRAHPPHVCGGTVDRPLHGPSHRRARAGYDSRLGVATLFVGTALFPIAVALALDLFVRLGRERRPRRHCPVAQHQSQWKRRRRIRNFRVAAQRRQPQGGQLGPRERWQWPVCSNCPHATVTATPMSSSKRHADRPPSSNTIPTYTRSRFPKRSSWGWPIRTIGASSPQPRVKRATRLMLTRPDAQHLRHHRHAPQRSSRRRHRARRLFLGNVASRWPRSSHWPLRLQVQLESDASAAYPRNTSMR